MKARKLQALRNLAERPGTVAEGEVARAMLAKLEAQREDPIAAFEHYLRTEDLSDLQAACDAAARFAEENGF